MAALLHMLVAESLVRRLGRVELGTAERLEVQTAGHQARTEVLRRLVALRTQAHSEETG
jgi:hypothetical protein